MLPTADSIDEFAPARPGELPEDVLKAGKPVVMRGLIADWPLVVAGRESPAAAIEYLKSFARRDMAAMATVAPPEAKGRVFYNDDMTGFNFRREHVPLPVALDTLRKYIETDAPPAIYVASTTIDTFLPGLRDGNDVAFGGRDPLASIWIGNRTRIAAHQDLPDNLACVAVGRRRVTLFPPGQLANLYIGPIDATPAGQPVSLVDIDAPDLRQFPRFEEAMRHAQVAELEAGDAVYIPSMWWHHFEALEAFNVLVNYWWRDAAAWMDTPMNTLMYALMTLRDLPPAERAIWQEVFRHYVFEPDERTAGHIPRHARGVLSPLDEKQAAELRARLLQRLHR